MSTSPSRVGLFAVSVTFATVVLFANIVEAQTVTACAGPQGQLRIVASASACRPSETATTWNLQGPKGDTGDPGAKGDTGDPGNQGPPGETGPAGSSGSGFMIVDALGQTVGPFLPESGRVMFHPSADAWVMVKVGQTFVGATVAGPSGPQLFYTQPNCEGTPYMQQPPLSSLTVDGSVVLNFPGFAPGLQAVYAKPPYQPTALASRFAPLGPVGGPYSCVNFSGTATVGEGGAIPLSGFVPVFKIVMP